MDCPKCGYILVEDPDVGLATCPECDTVVELEGGPDLPVPGGSMNMIPIGSTFRSAWKVFRQEMPLFLLVWSIPAILSFVIAISFILGANKIAEGEVISFFPSFLSGFYPILINILFSVVIVRMAADIFLHGKTNLSSGFGVFRKKFPIVLGASLLFALAIEGGALLCYIPALVCCYWWMFALIIIALEGASITEAFAVSKEFAKSRTSFSFALSIIMVIASPTLIAQIGMSYLYGANPTLEVMLATNIAMTLVTWILYPIMIIAIVAFYMTGRKALKTEMADKDGEGDEEDSSDGIEDASDEDEEDSEDETTGDEEGPKDDPVDEPSEGEDAGEGLEDDDGEEIITPTKVI